MVLASVFLSRQTHLMAAAQGVPAKRLAPENRFEHALGRTVKVMRAELGMERKELARLAGLSYPYISEIEQGKKRPSAESLAGIARAFQMRQSELLEHAERMADRTAEVAGVRGPLAKKERSMRRSYGRLYRVTPAAAAVSATELEELTSRAAQLGADDFHRVLDLVRRLTR